MKLIDLLVQELPKKGGWPLSIEAGKSLCIPNVAWKGYPGYAPLAYGKDEVVNFTEYHFAILSDSSQWNGEGVPPAGTLCEVQIYPDHWSPTKIVHVGKYHVIVESGDTERAYEIGEVFFRKAEEKKHSVDSSFDEYAKNLIKWINDNANPHAVILIDATSAVLYSGEKSITTEEFIKD